MKKILCLLFCLALVPAVVFAQTPAADPSSTRVIHITMSYDSIGKLIGQQQTITENGVALDGSTYTSVTNIDYAIYGGLAKATTSVSTTDKSWSDGSTQHSVTTTNYQYDGGGRLTGASGTRTISGSSAEYTDSAGVTHAAEKYSGSYTLTYQIISGQAMVVSETGSTTYSTYNEATGAYEENRTTTETTTFKYAMFAGQLKMTQSVSTSHTEYVAADINGKHYFEDAVITTNYTYNSNGALTGVSGSGTGSGYELTNDGNMSYTSSISVAYIIANGVARQSDYRETRNYNL